MRRFTPFLLPFALIACQEGITTPESASVETPAVAFAQSADRATAIGLAKQLLANGHTRGTIFLPPFGFDDAGNAVIAGSSILFLSGSWPDGSPRHACLVFSNSETNFFRVGPNDVAMNHVNGPADVGLVNRFTEAGDPLPELWGSGKMNMKQQGALEVVAFPGIAFYLVGEATSAGVVSVVGKVGEVTPDRQLRCGTTDDANGNQRNGYIVLN